MPDFDVLIRGGMVVDGTGSPRHRSDVGIKDGKVAEIGTFNPSSAKKVLDAGGMVVAPGFIDLHTHYDAQVFWDPYCSISGWHGVTSVVIGNCGFGFAPVHPEARDRAMQSLSRVVRSASRPEQRADGFRRPSDGDRHHAQRDRARFCSSARGAQ